MKMMEIRTVLSVIVTKEDVEITAYGMIPPDMKEEHAREFMYRTLRAEDWAIHENPEDFDLAVMSLEEIDAVYQGTAHGPELFWIEPEPMVGPNCEPLWFVNVYELDRLYGGPEEGGWWYEAGEIQRVYVFTSWEEATAARDRIVEAHPTTANRYSVLYHGGDIQVSHPARKPGEDYPKVRPHYE